MARKRKRSTFFWMVLVFVIISFAYFLYASFRIKQAQINLETYQRTQFCDEPPFCRQTLQATVTESLTARSVNIFRISRWRTKTEFQNLAYKLNLMLPNSEIHEVTILPDLNLKDLSFDLSNVSLPIVNNPYQDITKLYFPQYSLLKVEVWNGKVTFVHLKNIEFGITTTENSVITDEYAVPTTDHPLIAQTLLQDDFESFVGFALLSVVFLTTIKFVFRL